MAIFGWRRSLNTRKDPIFGCTIDELGPNPPGNLVEPGKTGRDRRKKHTQTSRDFMALIDQNDH